MQKVSMDSKNLIGLAGKKYSGKSTVSQYLARVYGYTPTHPKTPMMEMASPLIEVLGASHIEAHMRLDGIMKDTPIPGWELTGRKILQALGTEFPEALGIPDLWLQIWWKEYQDREFVIHESIRKQFEADFIRSKGGMVIKIVRPDQVQEETHITEQDVTADITLINDGTIDELYHKVDQLFVD
jgi:hypothetical protein